MMMRTIMILSLFLGIYYLVHARHRIQPKTPIPDPPPALSIPPAPAFSQEEIEKIRNSTKDADPAVRWAAIELLYRMNDPQALKVVEEALTMDIDPKVRKNVLDMLHASRQKSSVKDLLIALNDQEKDIRIAALMALGEIGDSNTAPYVTKLFLDAEPDVRLQALHALNQIQEKKSAAYKALTDDLKKQYEDAVRKSKKEQSAIQLRDVGRLQ